MTKIKEFLSRGVGLVIAVIVLWIVVLPMLIPAVQTAEDLRVESDRQERALHAGMVGTWELDLQSGRLHWSDSMFAIYGVDPPEDETLMGYDFWKSLLHPDDVEHADHVFSVAVKDNLHFTAYWRVIDKDGNERMIEAHAGLSEDGKRVSGVNFLAPNPNGDVYSTSLDAAYQKRVKLAQRSIPKVQKMRGEK